MPRQTNVLELECAACGKKYDASVEQHLCTCGKPLLAKYDLKKAAVTLTLESLKSRPKSLWRYAEVLPDDPPVTLGEGMTPLLPAKRLGASLGVFNLLVKYEDLNPTGSFKARGMTAAVSRAKQLNAKALAAPTAGNAGGALAAYAAAAGIPSVIVMPADTPSANVMECQAFGAKVIKISGLISDCGRYVAEHKDRERWYDVSTLKEPYRVEGKKTMGYELVEQLGWTYPDAVFYPTGGGVGLIGMWKAFEEMEQLGWVSGKRPKMIAVQASGCAPVARAWKEGAAASTMFENAATFAAGLRVPKPYGDSLILEIVRESGGTVVDLPDEAILASLLDWTRNEGLLLCPEGACATAAYDQLIATGFLNPEDRVVLFNTGSGLKYIDAIAEAMHLAKPGEKKYPQRTPVGGIITPQ
jgi:threonine synthase